jgi:chromosome partitioning protein
MDVLCFASRKGGSGKSTLVAHLSAHASRPSRRCLLIDADSQGSLTLWHKLRGTGEPALRNGARGVADVVEAARRDGYDWVNEAIQAATLVIVPTRLAVFDLAAIKETIDLSRHLRKPYAVVINAAPARRDNTESPFVTQAREMIASLNVPVWSGQITNRANYALSLASGEGVREFEAQSQAATEIGRLWLAIDRSVKAIHGAYQSAGAMHRVAA